MAYEKITASKLAKASGIQVKEIFNNFLEKDWILHDGTNWKLTDSGKEAGGEEKYSNRFGTYIVWPEDILNNISSGQNKQNQFLSSTKLGAKFAISPNRMNRILNELGWIDKGLKGWKLTKYGIKHGGEQKHHKQNGVPYVLWPEAICLHKALVDRINEDKGEILEEVNETNSTNQNKKSSNNFRERFQANHRTADGHMVRSRAEMLIDNWLYMSEIVHAYERKLPIEEDVYCDFYIPTGKVYVEFWGMENDQQYLERKKEKLAIYEKYGFNLIQLQDSDIINLDDILPRELLAFDIQTF